MNGTMPVGILTAAYPDICDPDIARRDPDQQIVEWLRIGKRLGVDCLQLSAAPPANIQNPDIELLDATPSHLDLTNPLTPSRVARIRAVCEVTGVRITELGCFANMLDEDLALRQRFKDHMIRVFDAAVELGVKTVCVFVGRDFSLSIQDNIPLFESWYIPILQEADARNLIVLAEHCPMPGWNHPKSFINNIIAQPDMWVKLWKIAEKHRLGHMFGITFDPSHLLLAGQNPFGVMNWLRSIDMHHIVRSMHVKGQVMKPEGIARFGYVGGQQTDLESSWDGQTSLCDHDLPGTATPDLQAYLLNLKTWWEGILYGCYGILEMDPNEACVIIEHEKPDFKLYDDPERMIELLKLVVSYTRGLNDAVSAQLKLFRLMHKFGIAPQTVDDSLLRADLYIPKSS